MSPGLIGALIGAVLGVVSYRTLSVLAGRVEKPETKKLLSIVAWSELALLPVMGYVIGQLAFGEGA